MKKKNNNNNWRFHNIYTTYKLINSQWWPTDWPFDRSNYDYFSYVIVCTIVCLFVFTGLCLKIVHESINNFVHMQNIQYMCIRMGRKKNNRLQLNNNNTLRGTKYNVILSASRYFNSIPNGKSCVHVYTDRSNFDDVSVLGFIRKVLIFPKRADYTITAVYTNRLSDI